ncbi:GDP-mannose pyrophosphatase [Dokdonia sp. Dokd-P16]|uniref:NUDIX domain-containing protein n=1 Tax=Dokdonia sp. Dokd-P16 TaxID=2173169 RepID=UPI000D549715|nr:NUDIX domain-containing protein [Dokdonia sp. Dokd-P16]AWH73584.1 GDP-mannose pyrophosphatase [Dokdonia sp. Dokd-P16]
MNTRVKNIKEEIISDQWATLKKVHFDYQNEDGSWDQVRREVYDRGDGACALLYNVKRQTVLLIKQFRLPAYLNEHDGFLVEACAGMIEDEIPEQTIIREIEEEMGYRIDNITKAGDFFMTPGSSTERIHMFLASYEEEQKVSNGGGLTTEHEDITVIEYAFAKALKALKNGEIRDAKTVILLQHLALSGIMERSN